MTEQTRASWLVYVLGALCAGAIVAAVLLVGPASGSQHSPTRTARVAQGVVQSTVSGSGNLQAADQLDLGFATAGTITHIYVTQGQHVAQGQLLATLDPQSAEVALEQARASLRAAEANLAKEEEDGGETSTNGASDGANTKGSANAPATTDSSVSAATREANLESARAAVNSDQLTVREKEQALSDTSLRAPESATIVSLGGQVGEVVAGTGTSRATTAATSSADSSATGTSTGANGSSSSSRSSANSSSNSSQSTSASFAVLADLSEMQLVVPLSESEIAHVHKGQIATVSIEALEGRKLAARVSEVATLSTSNSGVVSYDVTFQLEQSTAGLRPGMSASAEVVVKQAEGLSVPNSAITAGTVTVLSGGKQVRHQVSTGLVGDSSTIVLSGLQLGQQVVLPTASISGASSLGTRLAGRLGGAGAAGGARLFPGGGGFARGGG